MKKTLVALAVLAASGASFAQATITGTYAFGYNTVSGGGAATTGGMGTDTSDVNFAASEDLGGGMTASAKVGISGAHRGNAVVGNTATVGIKSSAFGVTLGTIESTNGLLAIGSSGASGYGLDGKVISGSSNIDILSLSVPLGGGLTVGASYVDRGNSSFVAGAAIPVGTGLGAGTAGAADGQPSVGLSLTYGAGAVAARIDYTSWTKQDEASTSTTGSLLRNKDRVRLSAAYDLKVARVSAGFSQFNRTTGITTTETLLGVKVPFGAVTLGLDYAVGQVTGEKDTSGYSLGLGYDLSKRTNIGLSAANWTQRGNQFQVANSGAAATENNTGFRVLVAHSF